MATNSAFQTSYSNERPPSQGSTEKEADATGDPASSSFFLNDYKKHEDLKQMLDSNKDNLKLEAMKRIIGMVAKGKDASDLFPAVVKNVVSKNIEVKKLVYVYLTRYAEEQQDLALLSISTFQRALKDPNQLIRGSALRVLSSIRVQMIVPIMMLAIKESVSDMSPYVRKTAAHAIPKLYSLDPEQKELLIEVIEKLLADKTTLVAGSAIQAFEEVCPERIDLIHKNYRKLCNLLVDVEEWGQVIIINMLTRYCRLQFVNPNKIEALDENDRKAFYGSSDDSDREGKRTRKSSTTNMMDPDHRLLLRTCRPLLNSRNAAVVMAVAQLYHHCAPKSEVSTVAKALIRLLRGHKEVQFVVLTNIASMSVKQKLMFEPYLKSFFVRFNDPTHVKLLKLEILTNLGNDTNISTILKEFQTYVSSSDKELAAATIQLIGRCATTISEITDTCLNGLLNLLNNRNETVVGESVIVIKKLLQMRPSEHKDIIIHMAKMADHISVPMAKASILWLIGEYSDRVPKIAPDVLRKMAKTFVDEEDIVKLQILNLASKLCITNPKQARPLCQYVFNLAKYDVNYDIRDRTRFLRQLVLMKDEKSSSQIGKHVKKIFLAPKPVPVLESKFKEMDHFQLGTLSHMICSRANGYQELPDWPAVAPDPSVRNIESAVPWTEKRIVKKEEKQKSFFSENESSSSGSSSDSSDDDSSSEESSGKSGEEKSDKDSDTDDDKGSKKSGSSSGEDEHDEESDDDDSKIKKSKDAKKEAVKRDSSKTKKRKESTRSEKSTGKDDGDGEDSDDDSDKDDDDEDSSDDETTSEEEDETKPPLKVNLPEKKVKEKHVEASKPPQLLLDLDDYAPLGPASSTVFNSSNILVPSVASDLLSSSDNFPAKANYSDVLGSTLGPRPSKELLNRMTGGGVSICYSFSRTISIFSPKMISIELVFSNEGDDIIEDIRMNSKKYGSALQVQEFSDIHKLAPGNSSTVVILVDFNDTTQPALFDVSWDAKKFGLSISPPIGEIIRPNTMSEKDFLALQGRLGGMNENACNVDVDDAGAQVLCNKVFKVANVLLVPCSQENAFLFAGQSASANVDVLVSMKVKDNRVFLKVNCEKIVIGSMLIKDIKESLLNQI